MRKMAVLAGAADIEYLLRGALASEGWDIQTFSLEEAMAAVGDAHPDVILVDIAPQREAESWEMLTSLRRDPTLAHVPVIVTADNQFELQNHDDLLARFAAAVLVRPCTNEDILHCLHAALDQTSVHN